MATTKDEIRRWIVSAKERGATHCIIVCDTFSYDDYPVDVMPGTDIHKSIADHSMDMQKVMEVYKMSMDLDKQLNSHRSNNI